MKTLDGRTQSILDDFRRYFDKFDKPVVDADELIFMLNQQQKRFSSDEERATHSAMVRASMQDVDEETKRGIVGILHETAYANKLAQSCIDYRAGKEIDLMEVSQRQLNEYKLSVRATDRTDGFINTPIGTILTESLNFDTGIKWRLEPLRRCMRPLQDGDFGLVCARPDRGKTSFFASELTHMASQTPDDRPILWLNNEGPGKRIYPRLYQAALGMNFMQILDLNKKAGQLEKAYGDVVGDPFKIRIKDIHGFTIGQVERIIEEQNPSIVVYDMVDNIKGFGSEARTDLALEKMYQTVRELAVLYEHVAMATSQISADGDGLLYPLQHMLKDSKTGKQGACDFQIMLGASNDPSMESMRGIGIVKNKLQMPNAPADPREEVHFNKLTSIYKEIQQ